MHLALIFVAGYASVFLLGFQSRNVNHGNYGWAAGTSFCIAIMQTSLWGALFHDLSWAAAFTYGLSGVTGITSSMFAHKRLILRQRKGVAMASEGVDGHPISG